MSHYKKLRGIIQVVITSYDNNFIEAVKYKTGEVVTFVLKYKPGAKFTQILDSIINNQQVAGVLCSKVDCGIYNYIRIVDFRIMLGVRERAEKIITYESLMREVEKDYNPVRTGSLKIGSASTIHTHSRLAGKIGNSLLKNVSSSANNAVGYDEEINLAKTRRVVRKNAKEEMSKANKQAILSKMRTGLKLDAWRDFLNRHGELDATQGVSSELAKEFENSDFVQSIEEEI